MDARTKHCSAARNYIQKIVYLSHRLPFKVALATKTDKIYTVFTRPEGESQWNTFNKCFDAVFGEDCRDHTTKKHHFI
jgi:hypothetical protein